MKTTAELIDYAKEKNRIPSDYALAQRLGVARQKISQIRTGTASNFRDKTALKIAALIGAEPGFVLATIAAEHSSDPETRDAWTRTAQVMASHRRDRRQVHEVPPEGIERRAVNRN